MRFALPVLAAVVALRAVAAADETAAGPARSVLTQSQASDEADFIDEQLNRQSARSLHLHRLSPYATPPADRKHRLWPWDGPTLFEHLRAFRREQKQLPPHFRHGSLHGRHLGIGEPLEGTSWLNRPWNAGLFVGALYGDDLIPGRVDQSEGLLAGLRLGYDFDHYWGTEGRFAFAHLDVTDFQDPPMPRSARNWYGDVSLLYYPWGDARWRPYASLGLGLAHFDFVDELGRPVSTVTAGLPIGIGVKHQWKRWLTLRLDLTDNIAFGTGGMDLMNSVSLSAGLEWRFGGPRRSYWPYDPSIHLQ